MYINYLFSILIIILFYLFPFFILFYIKYQIMKTNQSNKKLSMKNNKNEILNTRKTKKNNINKNTLLETISFKNIDNDLVIKYIVPKSHDKVEPKIWELPNRKRFFNWLEKNYSKYNLSKKQSLSSKVLSERKRKQELEKIELNNVQMLCRDFMQGESPYRGLLLYLGLGVGKTCAAIAITEAILNKKEVLILSKASLEDNFINDIQRCGADYMTKNNYWVFCKCNNEAEKTHAKNLNIPLSVIEENKGVFFIDFTKNKSNYQNMNKLNKEKLNRQIIETIRKRYKFLHLDDTRLKNKISEDEFNNKVIVVDEVHNLINTMASGRPSGVFFYEKFMKAKNAKFVFLSGTPLINTVFESTRIFNILRGYIPTITIKIRTTYDTIIEYNKIKNKLKKNSYVDQIIINKVNKTIKITKNPDNFITSPDNKGIIHKPSENIEIPVFEEQIEKIFNGIGYKISSSFKNETCLPEDINEFQNMFHNPELNKLKKTELFKKRIAGLVSFYKFQRSDLFPELLGINIERIPLNSYQLNSYEKYRNEEIQKDKMQSRKKGKEETYNPSYRLKSRLTCSFAYPEELGSPYDDKSIETLESLGTKLGDIGEDIDLTDLKTSKEIDKNIKASFLKLLHKRKNEFLDIKNGSLQKHSPKYFKMIQNITKSPGTCLVYSYFRLLIGLNTFSFALEQTGKYAPFRIKKVDGNWELDEKDDEKDKFKFCFYTGGENRELREIYRKVFNSEWSDLDPSCNKLVKQLRIKDKNNKENLYGGIIKIMMTTKTGAEGLNLKCVRQVHIMEPYWQPVLIEQVIGRAVRTNSHIRLPPRDRNVNVFIYMATFTPKLINMITIPSVRRDLVKFNDEALGLQGRVATSDEYLYIISERKKKIINEMLHLMKESAFDCLLNYKDNIKQNPNIVCLDYETEDRDDYLYASELGDTIDIIDLKQEKLVSTSYKQVIIKGKIYFYNPIPDSNGKMYIYDEKIKDTAKMPKPVGKAISVDGKLRFALKK